MDYEHHVFISYAHGDLWTPWVRDIFVPRLRAYLELEVGRLNIFVSDQIQPGSNWENFLKRKIARSMIMVALISASYFTREWCRREMAMMMEREKYLGMDGQGDNYGLLIPVRIGGGDSFPDLISRVQFHDFEDFTYLGLPAGTEIALRFEQRLKMLAKTVAQMLQHVPAFCDDWQNFAGEDLRPQLAPKVAGYFNAATAHRLIITSAYPRVSSDKASGSVITFYSFKGGIGRSMALANVAVLLARAGKRVLCIDWDLEAPGLGRYFRASPRHAPELIIAGPDRQGGLLDILESSKPDNTALWQAYLLARPIADGVQVDFIGSGEDAPDYSSRLAEFNWENFFAKSARRSSYRGFTERVESSL